MQRNQQTAPYTPKLLGLGTALLLSACGQEPCKVTESADGTATISCPDGSSATVSDGSDGSDGADGTVGATGPTGSSGPAGPSGASGTSNRITASLTCAGGLQNTSLFFKYQAVVLASGDVFASGGIYGAAFEIGASSYWAAGTVGAQTAAVLFTYDALGTANGGYWKIEVNRATAVATINYTDSDATGGSDSWTMLPAACVLYTAP